MNQHLVMYIVAGQGCLNILVRMKINARQKNNNNNEYKSNHIID